MEIIKAFFKGAAYGFAGTIGAFACVTGGILWGIMCFSRCFKDDDDYFETEETMTD